MRGTPPVAVKVIVAVAVVLSPFLVPWKKKYTRSRTPLALLATMVVLLGGCVSSFRPIAVATTAVERYRWSHCGRLSAPAVGVVPASVWLASNIAAMLVGFHPRWLQSCSSGWSPDHAFARHIIRSTRTSSTRLCSLMSAEEVSGGVTTAVGPSDWCTHVLVRHPSSLADLVEQVLRERRDNNNQTATTTNTATDLSAVELIDLGAVWHLPGAVEVPTIPSDWDSPSESPMPPPDLPHPSTGRKPVRVRRTWNPLAVSSLPVSDDKWSPHTPLIVQPGDYVRIHHRPRRFPNVHQYDWHPEGSQRAVYQSDDSDGPDDDDDDAPKRLRTPSVAVAFNGSSGWLVLNKPERVPVHGTVDNDRENVAACVRAALLRERRQHREPRDGHVAVDARNGNGEDEEEVYVSTPQRLDQNTSGLLVVATSKDFARYFAALLRAKTERQLRHNTTITIRQPGNDATDRPNRSSSSTALDAVHKRYRWYVP